MPEFKGRQLIACLACALFASCCTTMKNSGQTKPMAEASWLIGTWKNKFGKSEFTEIWSVKDDSTFSGKSFITTGKDSVFAEQAELRSRAGKLSYVVTVEGQNDGKPVAFTQRTITDGEMVFANPAHDFPTLITYRRITPDSIVATVSGGGRAERFPMARAKK